MGQYLLVSLSLSFNVVMAIVGANLGLGDECDWYLMIFVPDWIALVFLQVLMGVRLQE